MKNKPIDKITLAVVLAVLCVITCLNLFQTERPTYSETEKRPLAAMPALTWENIVSGEYFDGISDFFSDTFWARDALVSMAQKMERLQDLNFIKEIPGYSVIFDKNVDKQTEPEGTLPPLTLPPLPTEPEDSTPSTNPSTSVTEPPVALSASKQTVTANTGFTLTATLREDQGSLKWASSDTNIAYVTDNGDGTATIMGLAEGEVTITATVTDKNGVASSARCVITVVKPTLNNPGENADFLPGGMFIYNGAAYSQSYFSNATATSMAEIYDYFAQLFPSSTVSVVTAPLSTIIIDDPEINAKISDQAAILDKLEALQTDRVNFVNLKNVFLAHRSEYLFFKSDHHWTHLGAYYAYYEYAQSVGLTPRPLADFEVKELSTKYIGSMAKYTGDDRVKSFYDTVNAYLPSKQCTMAVTATDGKVYNYKFCINPKSTSYMAFLTGDHAQYVINVPENPQDKVALVFKDSFGNAFVPYLTEHYGNIIVIDPRYNKMNVYEMYKDQNITDIIFMYNATSANSSAWVKFLRNCTTGS